MDPWLTNDVKELLFQPCLIVSGAIADRMENRIALHQSIGETTLTDDLVDGLNTSSTRNSWGSVLQQLHSHFIYLDTTVTKSTVEHRNGADIGISVNRSIYSREVASRSEYAVLIQCKKIDAHGHIADFYHEVPSSRKRQSTLMLDITPSSFYFIFTPPSLVETYVMSEPIGFLIANSGCHSPIWNIGAFRFEGPPKAVSWTSDMKKKAVGILVVPALAVEAQRQTGQVTLSHILPNCLPFWYWFGQLLIPGFVGDRRESTIQVAKNIIETQSNTKQDSELMGVRNSLQINLSYQDQSSS